MIMTTKLSGSESRLLRQLRTRAIKKQNNRCYWCKHQMAPPELEEEHSASAEHVVPLHAGGRTTAGNVVAACRKCNNERHADMQGRHEITTAGDDSPRSPFEVLAGRFT